MDKGYYANGVTRGITLVGGGVAIHNKNGQGLLPSLFFSVLLLQKIRRNPQ